MLHFVNPPRHRTSKLMQKTKHIHNHRRENKAQKEREKTDKYHKIASIPICDTLKVVALH